MQILALDYTCKKISERGLFGRRVETKHVQLHYERNKYLVTMAPLSVGTNKELRGL